MVTTMATPLGIQPVAIRWLYRVLPHRNICYAPPRWPPLPRRMYRTLQMEQRPRPLTRRCMVRNEKSSHSTFSNAWRRRHRQWPPRTSSKSKNEAVKGRISPSSNRPFLSIWRTLRQFPQWKSIMKFAVKRSDKCPRAPSGDFQSGYNIPAVGDEILCDEGDSKIPLGHYENIDCWSF